MTDRPENVENPQNRVAADPYPSEPTATSGRFECQVCGATFEVVEGADGDAVLPDVSRFLSMHRRCLRRVLVYGGSLAKQTGRGRRA